MESTSPDIAQSAPDAAEPLHTGAPHTEPLPAEAPVERRRRFVRGALVVALTWMLVLPLIYGQTQASMAVFGLDLNDSYEKWANRIKGSDCGSYLAAGLGFAEGQGIAIRTEVDGRAVYSPFLYQVPGAPFAIGEMIVLCGPQHVWPYFFAASLIHLLTALGVMWLALPFTRRTGTLAGVGLLSLLCPPIIRLEFGWMLCGSEVLAHLPLLLALIALQSWWLRGRDSWRATVLCAIATGGCLALATYARGIYDTFGMFVALCVVVISLRGRWWKQAIVFALVGIVVLKAALLPWELRNKPLAGEACMCSSQLHACGLWLGMWSDWRVSEQYFGPEGCVGWGDYLDHSMSEGLYKEINANPAKGSAKAAQVFVQEVLEHPLKAAWFKLKGYDTLWIGTRGETLTRIFCSASLLVFLIFLAKNWRGMSPALWMFPLFMLVLSAIVQHEPRLTYPLYLLSTPIAFGVLWEQHRDKRKTLLAWREGPAEEGAAT